MSTREAHIDTLRKIELGEHERVSGNSVQAEHWYDEVLSDMVFCRANLDKYWLVANNCAIVAAQNGHFEHADSRSSLAIQLASGHPEWMQRSQRDAAGVLIKWACASSGALRAGRLREATQLLESAVVVIRLQQLGKAEEWATKMFIARCQVIDEESSIKDASNVFYEARRQLRLLDNPHYLLYCELDFVEVWAYIGQTWWVWPTAIKNLRTSWKWGQHGPPKHFHRAALNFAAVCLPLRLRRKLLQRLGALSRNIPPEKRFM